MYSEITNKLNLFYYSVIYGTLAGHELQVHSIIYNIICVIDCVFIIGTPAKNAAAQCVHTIIIVYYNTTLIADLGK